MSVNLSCLNDYPSLPVVPVTLNNTNPPVHPVYNPNSGSISQLISAALASSTFSISDVESLLKRFFNKSSTSWSVSEIPKTKPIPSVIIYTSITLALFLIFSIIFWIVSCTNSERFRKQRGRKSKRSCIPMFILILIYLLGISDMIYVGYRINQAKISMDNTIKEVNQDIYPRAVSEHIEYLNKQLYRLDQYFVDPNTILIKASKFMLVKAFNQVLNEKYLLQDIVQYVNDIDTNIHDLNTTISKDSALPPAVMQTFVEIQDQFHTAITYLQKPVNEVCQYSHNTSTDIDGQLLNALNLVHNQLIKVINTINTDVLSVITPWRNHQLINTDVEERIRGYLNLIGNIFLALTVVFTTIPLLFFVIEIFYRLCCRNRSVSTGTYHDPIPMYNVMDVPQRHSDNNRTRHIQYPDKHSPNNIKRSHHKTSHTKSGRTTSENGSCGCFYCIMHATYVLMIIMLIIMILVTGVFYALDLAIQGACRTVHDDQPFLINFAIEKVIESNIVPAYNDDLNRTVTDLIADCRDHVHFTKKLFDNYWSVLGDDIGKMMNTLSEHIFTQFINSIGFIDIPTDLNLIEQLDILSNQTNISAIVKKMNSNLVSMQTSFKNISSSNSTLSKQLIQSTIDDFQGYLKSVLELTIDKCPLPLSTIYQTDTLICHTLANSLNGLWLSIFFCMFLVVVGFCTFGIYVYKKYS